MTFQSALLFFGLLSSVAAQISYSCPKYNSSNIKLVTFDVFAALMKWEDSMMLNVAAILPSLTPQQVNYLVISWENEYSSAAGTLFEEGKTGAFPFSYFISQSLEDIIQSMNIVVTKSEFHELILSWSRLTPWPGTQETLQTLVNAGLTIAPLSNGDRSTLSSAIKVFVDVPFKYIFPSDFPVGSFKPHNSMYEQTLQVGYSSEEILHVAGGSTDAGGARDAGLFSVHLSHESAMQELKLLNGVAATPPCFVISDISDLPSILGL